MNKRKYDIKTILLILVLFLSNIGIMGSTVYSVMMTEMYENLDEWAINLVIALPGIIGLFACMIAGKVADKIDKKQMFIWGLILFAVTGTVFGGLLVFNNIGQVVAACISGGVCYGMVSVSSIGVIAASFPNEEQRSQVMGWYNGSMAAVGAVLALVYGNLAAVQWTYAFRANWATLPVAVVAIFLLPACPPSNNTTGNEEKVSGAKGWANRLIPIILAFFFVSLAYMTVSTYMDLYVSGNQLGDSAFTGILGSAGTIASFIACSLFGFTYGKMKTKITIPAYALIAVGILLMYFAPGRVTAIIACAIMGASWGTAYTYWFFRSTVVVPENMVGTATGLVTTANSLSYFPIPYLLTFLRSLNETESFTATLPAYAGIMIIVFVLAVIYKIVVKDSDVNELAQGNNK